MSVNINGVIQQISGAQKAAPELEKLKKATEGFEAIFMKKLFTQMRASVKETQFGQSFGKEIYEDMFNEAMANAAAKSKTLGLGDMLYRQFAPRVIESVNRNLSNPGVRPTSSLPVGDHESTTTKHDLAGRGTHPEHRDATTQRKS